jgi:hypothetical protein
MPYIASLCRSNGSRQQPVSKGEVQQSPSALPASNGHVFQLDYATWHAILSASFVRPADFTSHSTKEPAQDERDAIAA